MWIMLPGAGTQRPFPALRMMGSLRVPLTADDCWIYYGIKERAHRIEAGRIKYVVRGAA